jgi:hypothetical protein
MLYGNSSIGYGYSPDRSKDTVSFDNYREPFLGASGNRITGYYYSPNPNSRPRKDEGEWRQSGSGAWFRA